MIDLLIPALKAYKQLRGFVRAAPCGLVELTWERAYGDFRFTQVNQSAEEIIKEITTGEKLAGQLLCTAVPEHREAIMSEGGLSTAEIYRRVAFKIPPYESGKREATLAFPSKKLNEIKYYQQTVIATGHGKIAIGFFDITEKIRLIHALEQQTITDQLTGLYTGAYMYRAIDEAVARSQRGEKSCYLRIDLDGFGLINKRDGHQTGDASIQWAANQIADCTRKGEPVGRMGGDEFAALLTGDLATGKRTAERIRQALTQPFMANGKAQQISASIGVAEIESASTSEEIDARADAAQRQAKTIGKNRVVVWGDASGSTDKAYQLEQELIQAAQRKEFILHYQPIVRLATGDIEGYEALVRWQKGDRLIYPDKFVPVMEDNGSLHLACRLIFEMAAKKQEEISQWIGVNVSPATLERPDFREIIAPMLKRPNAGHFEITERLLLSIKARNEIQFLQEMGGVIALDDFGTGASRYHELHRVDLLKIDKSLIDDIDQNEKAFKICAAIVSLARNLGLHVVAEGVETSGQAEALKIMRCEYGQGYLFGRPGPLD